MNGSRKSSRSELRDDKNKFLSPQNLPRYHCPILTAERMEALSLEYRSIIGIENPMIGMLDPSMTTLVRSSFKRLTWWSYAEKKLYLATFWLFLIRTRKKLANRIGHCISVII